MKRVTVLVTESFQHATLVRDFLNANDVDAKLVTKHAVQVVPSHIERTTELNSGYSEWVESLNNQAKERSAARG